MKVKGIDINYVQYGNPNGKDLCGEPLPEWTPYTSEKSNFMEFTTYSALNEIPPSAEMKKYL